MARWLGYSAEVHLKVSWTSLLSTMWEMLAYKLHNTPLWLHIAREYSSGEQAVLQGSLSAIFDPFLEELLINFQRSPELPILIFVTLVVVFSPQKLYLLQVLMQKPDMILKEAFPPVSDTDYASYKIPLLRDYVSYKMMPVVQHSCIISKTSPFRTFSSPANWYLISWWLD